MLDISTWLEWTILVVLVLTICTASFALTARAVGGWRELRAQQFSSDLPTRYLVAILPLVIAATLLIDPTDDLDGWEWLSGVGLWLGLYVWSVRGSKVGGG